MSPGEKILRVGRKKRKGMMRAVRHGKGGEKGTSVKFFLRVMKQQPWLKDGNKYLTLLLLAHPLRKGGKVAH